MELELKNFKCYNSHTITLPTSPFVLIRGKNGIGKTTVFKAIIYTLYGKQKKPFSHGTTTCKVILRTIINGKKVEITRTTRPNTIGIVINDVKYQSVAAQSKINELLGMDHTQFVAACCVRERDMSILDMSATQRLEFIESLSHIKDRTYKKNIKQRIKDLQTTYNTIEREVAVRKETYKTFKSQVSPVVSKPIGSIKSLQEEREQVLRVIETKRDEIIKLRKLIDKLQVDILAYTVATEQKSAQYAKYNQLKDELSNLEVFEEDIISKVRADISTCERTKRVFELKDFIKSSNISKMNTVLPIEEVKEYQRIVELYEEETRLDSRYKYIMRETKSKHAEIKRIFSDVPDFGDSMDVFKRRFADYETLLSKLKEEKTNLKLRIKKLNAMNVPMKCPACSKELCVKGTHLTIFKTPKHTSEKLSEELYKVCVTLATIKDELEKFKSIKTDIVSIEKILAETPPIYTIRKEQYDDARSAIAINKEAKKKQKDIEASIAMTKRYEIELKELLEAPINPTYDNVHHAYLIKELENIKERIRVRESLKQRKCIEKEKYNNMPDPIKPADPETSTLAITCHELAIIDSQNKLNMIEKGMRNWEDYHSFKKKYKLYLTEREKYQTAKKTLIQTSSDLSGHIGVLDACNEAEILTNQTIVDLINSAAETHLSRLFDDEITMTIEAYKKNADGTYRPCMTVTGEYDNNELVDHSEDLSDGNIQKCVLAFRLAIGDVLGRDMLFLDESFNKLDNENYGRVMEYLSEYARESNVRIYVISHHPYTGMFDEICDLI